MARKPAARKTTRRKPAARKAPARKTAAKRKPAARKTTRKAPARRTAAKRKPAARKPARRTAAKRKPAARKPARRTAARKPAARKPAARAAAPARPATPTRSRAPKAVKVSGKTGGPGTVTLAHLVAELSDVYGLPKKAMAEIFDDFVDVTKANLKLGNKIRITGLGILQVRKRAARMGRNPQTGEPIKIKASKKVGFRVAKDLKLAVL